MEIIATSGLINAIIALSFGLLVVRKNWRERGNQLFLLMIFTITVWGVSYWQWLLNRSLEGALFWVRLLSVGSLFIPIFFLHWVTVLVGKEQQQRLLLVLFYLVALVIFPFYSSDLFIQNVEQKLFFEFWPNPGPLYNLYFSILYLGAVIYGILLLVRCYRIATDDALRGQILYVLFGTLIGFGGGLTNFFLWYDIPVAPYGNFLVAAFPFFLGYSIVKNKLFNVKAIATELLTFSLWAFMLVRILIADSVRDQIINSIVLALLFFAGILLIRSVYREVEQREKIEKLSEEKSEFMSFASHQVKGPLTNVKVATSMLLAGDFGPLPDQIKEIVKGLYDTAEKAIPMVQNFLDISKLEQSGGMQFDKKPIDIRQVAEEVMSGQKITAEAKGLGLEFSVSPEGNFTVNADPTKIKEVIFNLIDNAIKYTPRGKVEVTLRADGQNKKVLLSVRDSGVGLTADDLVRLFTKFGRGKDAKRVNTHSSGLGLYLARQIVDAHGGRIWAESEGSGSGSVFTVELPTDR